MSGPLISAKQLTRVMGFIDEGKSDDDDEAVAMANDTTYGLAATAWTTNLSRAHRLAKRLQAGTVSLNCQLVFDHSVPFGGYKRSGWGHEVGHEGVEAYLQTKSVWAQL
jgi:acyl-CoA reductase-like NAD-dependent aldehyde dehydrogenase